RILRVDSLSSMGRRLQWLLLPVALAEEGTQCFDGGIKVDPESLSAFAWQELAQGHNYYRCLHDVTSYTTMLTALYFGTADPPVSVLVKDAAALGAVWLNPKVQDHFLLYTHGAEVMSVHAIGTNLTADHFPHADHCGPLPCSVVEVAEADADCASASGCQAEVARWMGVLAEKQAVEQDVEPAFCTMATLASQEDSPRRVPSCGWRATRTPSVYSPNAAGAIIRCWTMRRSMRASSKAMSWAPPRCACCSYSSTSSSWG
ncbi:unnamed protein product, partial [Effrenium voratum]